ncbi:MAG: glycosyltransferase [Candidatus Omnitrophota bacterium]
MDEKSNRLVSVIVVTAGVKDYIFSCLDSLRKQNYPATEVIIIDNFLNPVLGSRILSGYSFARIYPGKRSLSYCDSLNKGIGLAKGDFILCLNDDVVLSGGFITEAIKGFDIGEKIGMVSGKVLRLDGKLIDSTGLYLSLWRTAKERGYGCKDTGQFDKPGYIFGVTGAVAFYRRKMLEEVKIKDEYFDSDFGFFYEDLDIGWRANNSGWKGYYMPSAIAYHARGGTARAGNNGTGKKYARIYLSEELHFKLIKNRYFTIIKNENIVNFIIHLPFIIIYDLSILTLILLFRIKVLKIFFFEPIGLTRAFKKRRGWR